MVTVRQNTAVLRAPGFTLVEFLIIALILGIIAMMGLPAFNSTLEDSRVNSAADEIAAALDYAKAVAINTGGQTKVTIDDSGDTILVEQFKITANLLGVQKTLPEADVENGSYVTMERPLNRGTKYKVTFSDHDRFNGVDITSSTFGAGNFLIFNALGIPSDGGTVKLNSENRQVVITVDDLTGKTTIGS